MTMKVRQNFYEYTVTVYYEDDRKCETKHGVTLAYSYREALQTLIRYYGEDDLCSVSLSPVEDGEVYEFEWNSGNSFDIAIMSKK